MNIFQPFIFIGRSIFLAPIFNGEKKKQRIHNPWNLTNIAPWECQRWKFLVWTSPTWRHVTWWGDVMMCASRVGFSAKFGLFRKASFPTQSWHILRFPMVRKHQPAVVTRKSKGVFETPHTKPKHPGRKSRSYKVDGTKFSQITWDRNKNGGNSFGIFTISTRWPDSFHHFFSQHSHKILCLFVRSFGLPKRRWRWISIWTGRWTGIGPYELVVHV